MSEQVMLVNYENESEMETILSDSPDERIAVITGELGGRLIGGDLAARGSREFQTPLFDVNRVFVWFGRRGLRGGSLSLVQFLLSMGKEVVVVGCNCFEEENMQIAAMHKLDYIITEEHTGQGYLEIRAQLDAEASVAAAD